MSDYISKIFDATRKIDDISLSLRSLSAAFYKTGNSEFGETLYRYGESLEKNSYIITRAVGEQSTKSLEDAQQATANVINTALAMSKLEDQKLPSNKVI